MCGYDPFENYEHMLDKQHLEDLAESEKEEDEDSDYWYERLVVEERLFNPYAR
jgi:hypothetical protein